MSYKRNKAMPSPQWAPHVPAELPTVYSQKWLMVERQLRRIILVELADDEVVQAWCGRKVLECLRPLRS